MQVPIHYSSRGLADAEARYGAGLARECIDRLARRADSLTRCRVDIERDRTHVNTTAPVQVSVQVHVAGHPPLVAVRSEQEGEPGEGVGSPVRTAFAKVDAQLRTLQGKRHAH
jgi:hypothetical protein